MTVNRAGTHIVRRRLGGHTMTQGYETGKAMAELGAKQPHELLLMLGGLLAILLSVAIYGIQAANQGIQPSPRPNPGELDELRPNRPDVWPTGYCRGGEAEVGAKPASCRCRRDCSGGSASAARSTAS